MTKSIAQNDVGVFKPGWPDHEGDPEMSLLIEEPGEHDGWGMVLSGSGPELEKGCQGIAATPEGVLCELAYVGTDNLSAVHRKITDAKAREILLAASPLLRRLFAATIPERG